MNAAGVRIGDSGKSGDTYRWLEFYNVTKCHYCVLKIASRGNAEPFAAVDEALNVVYILGQKAQEHG